MASNRALLVAINNYGSQQNNLPSCLDDASQFRSLLGERCGFADFKEFYDDDASVANVEKGLAWLFKGATPEDRLVFFYSGHGFQQPKGGNLEECLVLGDMKFFFDDRLTELSQSAPPGVLTVVLDSCFSGGMQKRIALDGRIEIARTKAWMPPPTAMMQQQKVMMAQPLVPRPFGCWQVTSSAGAKRLVLGRQMAAAGAKAAQPGADGEDETDQLALNGLLLSACSENETASASTSATEGLSAFSYALRHVFGGAEGEPSAAELLEGARAKLQEMGFQQTPLLKAPAEPADLASMGFVTLAPAATAQAAAGAAGSAEDGAAAAPLDQPAKGVALGAQRPARPAAGGAAGATTARPGGNGAAAALTGAAPASLSEEETAETPTDAASSGPAARPAAGMAPRQQQAAPSHAAGAAGAANTTGEEESPMDTTMQANEEKWVGLVARAIAPHIPEVIRAVRRKDNPSAAPAMDADADADQDKKWGRAVREAIRAAGGFFDDDKGFAPATPAMDADDQDKKWGRIVREAIRAAGGFFDDDKGFAPAAPAMDADADADQDKKWGRIVREAIRAAGGFFDDDKGFAPADPASGSPSSGGDAEGAEEKWVAALARAVAPALVQAAPGIINAVRGKDVHILPYPTGRPPRPHIPSDWQRPARGGGGAVVRKDVAAVSNGPAEGDEKFLPIAIGIAGAVIPEVIRAVANRRKEFELT